MNEWDLPTQEARESTRNGTGHPHVKLVLTRRGITRLLPVQQEAIDRGLLGRRSFLVCAPSGSGKTLVGELAAVSAVLDHYGKVAYLVPYRALAAQKAAEFRHLYEPCGIHVALATGDEDPPDRSLATAGIIVTTFEKLDSALRNAKTQEWANQLAVVVADEFHEIGEPKRGGHLEGLLMRLFQRSPMVQLVALSATVGNPGELASWLNTLGMRAGLITSEYRPVPLSYGIVANARKDQFIQRTIYQVLQEGGLVLIFNATRKEAEEQARSLVGVCGKFVSQDEKLHIQEALQAIEAMPGHSSTLRQVMLAGVAFHHAGLDRIERGLVEKLFNARAIKVVSCTTTLAAGINTPARVVILRGVEMKKRPRVEDLEDNAASAADKWVHPSPGAPPFLPFPPNQVFQLLGRAGRPGFDPDGQGILLTSTEAQATWAREYYFATKEITDTTITGQGQSPRIVPLHDRQPRYTPLRSQLNFPDALRELMLVQIHELGRVTLADLQAFFRSSLLHYQKRQSSLPESPRALPLNSISFLLKHRFIRRVTRTSPQTPVMFEATRLGALTARLYVPPSKALLMLDALSQNSPASDATLLRLGCDLVHGHQSRNESSLSILEQWIEEVSVEEIVRRTGKSLGDIAVVNLEVSRYLKIIARFAEYLDCPENANRARTLAQRVLHGIKDDLLDLVSQVPGIGRLRGRLLVNAGLNRPADLAQVSITFLAQKTGISPRVVAEIKAQCARV